MGKSTHDKPCAAPDLTSYRYPDDSGGWVMIGARDYVDALREASRSLQHGIALVQYLQVWNGSVYVPVAAISVEHGPWVPSSLHEGETYCKRCLMRSIFLGKKKCEPHIEMVGTAHRDA